MADAISADENIKKLEMETENVRILKEMSKKCCMQTAPIHTILSNFDAKLARLETSIQPVYMETVDKQSKQAVLQETLEELEHVIQYYSVTGEVESMIRSGPSNQLKLYMDSLRRLKQAYQYFSKNNPQSPEYENVKKLFQDGCDAIEEEFKNTLVRCSAPMAPISLMEFINDDGSDIQPDSTNSGTTTTTGTSESMRRYQPDQDRIADLKLMSEWLCSNCNENLIGIYSNVRSDFISKSLESLQAPGASRSSVDSPDMAMNKKRLGSSNSNARDPYHKRTPKYIQQAFKRKLHNVIPGDVLASYKSGSSSIDDSITEREILSYITCITAFHKLAVNELNFMSQIIPADLKISIYNNLIQDSLILIANEANKLVTRVKRSLTKHDFKSALNLFPILNHQTSRRHNFDLLFDECQSPALTRFQGLTITFRATISNSLEEFAQFVHSDSDLKVPADGTVHELTNNVMIFIEQLHEYLDIMADVIPVKDMQAMENSTDKNRLGFAQYITRLLSSLGETIQRKAEGYSSLHLIFIFKLNNFHYILKRLIESGLLEIVHIYNPNVGEIYEHMINDSRNEYLKSLYLVINHLRDVQESKSKSIKDRFAGFNKEFQEFHRLNRTYAIPDHELRRQVRESSKREFLGHYQHFYNTFVNQDFSKNKEKYIKYTPELLASMIDQFFESN